MLKNQLVKDIRLQLEKLQHLTDLVSKSESPITEVEFELMQKSILKVMEGVTRLKVASEQDDNERVLVPVVEKNLKVTPTPVVEEVRIKDEPIPPVVVAEPEPMQIDHTEVYKPKIVEPLIVAEVKKQAEEKIVKSLNLIDEPSLHENLKTLNDLEPTLHEKLSAGAEKVLAHKLQELPIADLTKEITLNKKFGFVNDLFNGSMENYNAAINHLNQAGNLSTSLEYIQQNLKKPRGWKDDSPAVKEFMDYIRRRWS